MGETATLPQKDPDAAERVRALHIARERYRISFNIVPGVPMAEEVPEEATPSKEWTVRTLIPLKNILANVIANRIVEEEEIVEDAFTSALKKGITLPSLFKGIAASFEQIGDLVEHLGLDASHTLMRRVLRGQHITQHDDPTAKSPWMSPLTPHGRPESIASYDELYREIERPPVMDTWQDDAWFAQMRVAGQNPMLLAGIDEIPAKFPVTEEHYARTAEPGDTLAAALKEGRLFILDYWLIGETVKDNTNPIMGERKYTPAPIGLFGVPPGSGTLRAIAIQVGQDPQKFAITTPGKGWSWQKAKTAVQVADANHHELVCHLGQTHLIMEAAALATMRNLSDRHPLYKLLLPHFEGTLAINNSAAHSMLAPGGVIDLSFGGTLDSMIELAGRAVSEYDFMAAMPPADFERRKVTQGGKLTDYPYRDDALRVWDAISDWAASYVEYYYDEDSLKHDAELAEWAKALAAPLGEGGIVGFPKIEDTATLSQVLAMIMFTASAQHAAVNFTQRADMSYSPALAGALWAEWKDGDATEQDWLDLLPPLQFGELQAEFLALLGGVHHTHLGEYKSNSFPYPDIITEKDIVEGPLAAFQAKLREIEVMIERENETLKNRSAAYIYMLPSKIPASINI
jgi:arachidonate 15-lipoxygenase